jgi:hypothetical protein
MPQPPPATEVVDLLREVVGYLAAMRAMMDTAQAPPVNQPDNEVALPLLIERGKADLLTLQDAAGIAERDESTMRRWNSEFGIGTRIRGTPYIYKSKLLDHLEPVKKRRAE